MGFWSQFEKCVNVDKPKFDTLNDNKSLIFLVDNPKQVYNPLEVELGTRGLMNLNQRFGFVFGANNGTPIIDPLNTLAHELGHGTFGLNHTDGTSFEPNQNPQVDSQNIMMVPYNPYRTQFRRFQWDIMHQ